MRGKGGGEDGCKRRDGAVHQSSEARLNNLENETAAFGFAFLVCRAGGFLLLIHFLREVVVLALLSGEIPEQLTHRSVARLCDGGPIEIARLVLHCFHLTTDHCDRQIGRQPKWFAGDEPFNILASDQRDMFTEPFPIEADQSMPMAVLLVAHRLKRLRRCGIILADSLRQVGVNSPVFLLGLDRESKDLLSRKIFEPFGHLPPL